MKIPLTRNQVLDLAESYRKQPFYDPGVSNGEADDELDRRFRRARVRGHLVTDDLLHTAQWKYPGPALLKLVKQNTRLEVEEISRVSFNATTPRLRIGALLALHGVSWPMASVILHFAFPDRYPILDKRVMRTIGGAMTYNFDRWVKYTDLCQRWSRNHDVPMRALDRALWTYDKDESTDME